MKIPDLVIKRDSFNLISFEMKKAIAGAMNSTGQDIFIPLSLLDQILSTEFFFQDSFGGEICDKSGYFDTLPSSLSLIKVASWLL